MSADGSSFRFRHAVDVRFRDLDPMGHAHHSLPLVYFEEARAAYWRDVAGRAAGVDDVDYVMAEVTARFHARIRYPDSPVVSVRVQRLGGSSFEMEYELRGVDGTLLATGSSTQVMYDYEAERTRSIPDDLRRTLADYEGIAERD